MADLTRRGAAGRRSQLAGGPVLAGVLGLLRLIFVIPTRYAPRCLRCLPRHESPDTDTDSRPCRTALVTAIV